MLLMAHISDGCSGDQMSSDRVIDRKSKMLM